MRKILFFILILFVFIGCEQPQLEIEREIYTGSKSDGRLSGKFSVSPNNKVYFSQGNLCAKYSEFDEEFNSDLLYCFFFANQWETSAYGSRKLYYGKEYGSLDAIETPYPSDIMYEYRGDELVGYCEINEASGDWLADSDAGDFRNFNNTKSYFYVDLFPWGIIGDDLCDTEDHSVSHTDVFNATSLNEINADWGSIRILNGGNTPGWWRTLSSDEWEYLMFERENADSLIGYGVIGNIEDGDYEVGICGLILLPDDSNVKLKLFHFNESYNANQITFEEWKELEAKGAVFLPADYWGSDADGGLVKRKDLAYDEYTYYWDLSGANVGGYYWSSTSLSDKYSYDVERSNAHCLRFDENGYKYDPEVSMAPRADKINDWMPIRLVQDVE